MHLEATEKKDHAYGVIGLVKGAKQEIRPDYERRLEELWMQCSVLYIRYERRFGQIEDIQTRAQRQGKVAENKTTLPSWRSDRGMYLYNAGTCTEKSCGQNELPRGAIQTDERSRTATTRGSSLGVVTYADKTVIGCTPDEVRADARGCMVTAWKNIAACIEWAEGQGISRSDMRLWSILTSMLTAYSPKSFEVLRDAYTESRIEVDAEGTESVVTGSKVIKFRTKKSTEMKSRVFLTDQGHLGFAWFGAEDECPIEFGDEIYNVGGLRAPAALQRARMDGVSNTFEFLACIWVPGLEHVGCSEFWKRDDLQEVILV